ncbi:MAG TPA: TonB family protein [Stellaceae bacterium]|nr:TonB family protein [Stellaceae bacterium]
MPTDFLTLTRAAGVALRPGRRDVESQPCLLPDSITLTDERTALPDDHRHEPALAAAPFFVEFAEIDRLDPARGESTPDAPVASASAQGRPIRAPIGSLLIHLLVLAVILAPALTAPDLPKAIPIQLVLEPPPSAPKPASKLAPPAPEAARPPGRLSSDDEGVVTPKAGEAPTQATKAAAPKPVPQPKLVPPPPPPKPEAPIDEAVLLKLPKIPAPVLTPPAPAKTPPQSAPQRAVEQQSAGHAARVPGPSATKDQYLAYLVTLTRQHFDLVPMSLIGDRQGETSLLVVVLADGTIARISIEQGSGYPDIDRRVEQMVRAVGRFPPLPQWYQRNSMDLIFKLRFPQAINPR